MTFYNRIQELIIRCIARDVSVKAFREQFVPIFFALNRRFDVNAVVLADNVDNLYADLLIGELTEDEFRQKLIQLTPVVMTDEVEMQRLEWAFETTTTAPPAEEVGPPNQVPETSSTVQLVRFACV